MFQWVLMDLYHFEDRRCSESCCWRRDGDKSMDFHEDLADLRRPQCPAGLDLVGGVG